MHYILISDIHANWQALQAVSHAVEELRFALQRQQNRKTNDAQPLQFAYWFLGDLFGYGAAPDAAECLNWLRFKSRIGKRWLPGNHDEWLLTRNGTLRREAEVTNLAQREYLAQNRETDLEWFTQFAQPILADESDGMRTEQFETADGKTLGLAFVHASIQPGQRRGSYLYPWNRSMLIGDLSTLPKYVQAERACLICGHTHFPVLAHLDEGGNLRFLPIKYGVPQPILPGKTLINPGSVGQPRDGDHRAAFAMLDTNAATITFHRVRYDIRETVEHLAEEANTRQYLAAYQAHRPKATEDEYFKAYLSLIEQLENGSGGEHQQLYGTIYRRPEWDLMPVG